MQSDCGNGRNPEETIEVFTTDMAVGLASARNTRFGIYPVPARDQLHVVGIPQGTQQLQVLDAKGGLVQQFAVTNNRMALDVSALAKGMYQLRVANEDEPKLEQFLKE